MAERRSKNRRLRCSVCLVMVLSFFAGLVVAPSPALSEFYPDFVQVTPKGKVDWTSGTVTATGIGFPPDGVENPARGRVMAERAAFVEALRNLLEVVKGVRVDATSVVEERMLKSSLIQTRVSGFVRGAKKVRRDVNDDGSVEVEVAVPMWGDNGLNISLFDEIGVGSARVEEAPSPEGYTSLVIDARGSGLTPELFPTIADTEGNIIYSPEIVDKNAAAKHGMVQYVTLNEDDAEWPSLFILVAEKPSMLGRKPLRVKGVSGGQSSKATIMMSADDAKKISQSKTRVAGFLKQARVVIILDPQMGGVEQ